MEGWQQRGAPRRVCPSPGGAGSAPTAGSGALLGASGAPRKVPAVSRAAAQPAGQCPGDSVPLRFARALHKEGGERAVPRRGGISAANNARQCPFPRAARLWAHTASPGAAQHRGTAKEPLLHPGAWLRGGGGSEKSLCSCPRAEQSPGWQLALSPRRDGWGHSLHHPEAWEMPTLLRQGQDLPWEAEQQESSRSVCPAAS